MLNVKIPSYGELFIENIIFDYNGTLAVDGKLIEGVKEKLFEVSKLYNIYVVTADTYGTVRDNFKNSNIEVEVIAQENGSIDKLNFLKKIGSHRSITVGNGNNDELMLRESAIGISILGEEGLATKALLASDIIVKDIMNIFSLITNSNKIIAALRK